MSQRFSSIVVLKFGGSVLKCEPDLALAVHEIHRHVREGRSVVAVTSAFAGTTDALLARAAAYGPETSEEATAALAALGEQESAALLALALDRAGLRATLLTPCALGIAVDGSALAATVRSTDPARIIEAFDRGEVVVAPGFVGVDRFGRVALLGRGGSDLTAVILADALDAECVLLKVETALADARVETRPRVALLGLGTIGRGVYERLIALEDRFDLIGAAVRDVARHTAAGVPREVLTTDALGLARHADLVIELIGGWEPAATIVEASLRRGAQVVTANKSLVAQHGQHFDALVRRHGGAIRFGAAVGGAAPCLELVERVGRRESIVGLEGVINGTTNVILDRIRAGSGFPEAVAFAQRRGFAEADPSSDIDGVDAAEKLRILCRVAFGREPDALTVAGIRNVRIHSGTTRLVARATLGANGIVASVRPERLDQDHPLIDVNGCWNRLVVTTQDGAQYVAHGKGAGRWPTTEAVIADALDAHQALSIAQVLEEVVA